MLREKKKCEPKPSQKETYLEEAIEGERPKEGEINQDNQGDEANKEEEDENEVDSIPNNNPITIKKV